MKGDTASGFKRDYRHREGQFRQQPVYLGYLTGFISLSAQEAEVMAVQPGLNSGQPAGSDTVLSTLEIERLDQLA